MSRPLPALSVVSALRAAGCVFAEAEAELLAAAATDDERLAELVHRRASGTPLEHLLGWAEFCGQRIVVTPGVFVPRRRSEFLVARAVALAAPHPVVVDLCCGSGALGAAVSAALPGAEVHAADVDPVAVSCARHNVPRVYQGDLFDALPTTLRRRVDLLLTVTPYVPTGEIRLMPPEARDHEPRAALDGGADGLAVLRRVAEAAPDWLAPGGLLLTETSERQAAPAVALLEGHGLPARVETSEEDVTIVVGRRPTG